MKWKEKTTLNKLIQNDKNRTTEREMEEKGKNGENDKYIFATPSRRGRERGQRVESYCHLLANRGTDRKLMEG